VFKRKVQKIKIIFFLVLFIMCLHNIVHAQSLPVGYFEDDIARALQLQGKISPSLSFTQRPLYNHKLLVRDSLLVYLDSSYHPQKQDYKSKWFQVEALPVSIITKNNTTFPFGWNDGLMEPARGRQTLIAGGAYARTGPLSIQLQPEIIRGNKKKYDITREYGDETNGPFQRIWFGQSNILISAAGMSAGISTENLWWGPGRYSSLFMSNNAPGFFHYTFKSNRPLKTPIGYFEWNIVSGTLKQDTSFGFENFYLKKIPFSDANRFFNAITVSYQPKWIPGFFIGANRSFQMYEADINLQDPNFIERYLPVFSNLFKQNTNNEDQKGRDQLVNIFTRWLFPKTQAEFYFEYGWNDHKYNNRDFIIDPVHAASYLLGFRKIQPLNKKQWIDFTTEIIQMSQTPDFLVRNAGNWYEHGLVTQGYTNMNQIMGAGSGKGNNVQTFATSWHSGLSMLGIKTQRIQHDPVQANAQSKVVTLGQREHIWTDYVFSLEGRYRYKNWLVNINVNWVKAAKFGFEFGKRKNVSSVIALNYLW
jgi:hypothetical protein